MGRRGIGEFEGLKKILKKPSPQLADDLGILQIGQWMMVLRFPWRPEQSLLSEPQPGDSLDLLVDLE